MPRGPPFRIVPLRPETTPLGLAPAHLARRPPGWSSGVLRASGARDDASNPTPGERRNRMPRSPYFKPSRSALWQRSRTSPRTAFSDGVRRAAPRRWLRASGRAARRVGAARGVTGRGRYREARHSHGERAWLRDSNTERGARPAAASDDDQSSVARGGMETSSPARSRDDCCWQVERPARDGWRRKTQRLRVARRRFAAARQVGVHSRVRRSVPRVRRWNLLHARPVWHPGYRRGSWRTRFGVACPDGNDDPDVDAA